MFFSSDYELLRLHCYTVAMEAAALAGETPEQAEQRFLFLLRAMCFRQD